MPSYKLNEPRSSLNILARKKPNEPSHQQKVYSDKSIPFCSDNDIYKTRDPFEFLENENDCIYKKEEDDDLSCDSSCDKTDTNANVYENVYENYPLNDDHSPKLIRKKPSQKLEYVQEIYIRYLRPPSPEPPGIFIFRKKYLKLKN